LLALIQKCFAAQGVRLTKSAMTISLFVFGHKAGFSSCRLWFLSLVLIMHETNGANGAGLLQRRGFTRCWVLGAGHTLLFRRRAGCWKGHLPCLQTFLQTFLNQVDYDSLSSREEKRLLAVRTDWLRRALVAGYPSCCLELKVHLECDIRSCPFFSYEFYEQFELNDQLAALGRRAQETAPRSEAWNSRRLGLGLPFREKYEGQMLIDETLEWYREWMSPYA
jgi:hypothetical protein